MHHCTRPLLCKQHKNSIYIFFFTISTLFFIEFIRKSECFSRKMSTNINPCMFNIAIVINKHVGMSNASLSFTYHVADHFKINSNKKQNCCRWSFRLDCNNDNCEGTIHTSVDPIQCFTTSVPPVNTRLKTFLCQKLEI